MTRWSQRILGEGLAAGLATLCSTGNPVLVWYRRKMWAQRKRSLNRNGVIFT